MARKINSRNRKPYIIIFWEGESEQVYMNEIHAKKISYVCQSHSA